MDRARRALAQAVRDRITGPDYEDTHERIWHTPGPRWFVEGDAIWQVHVDIAMFIGGIRALLLQSLHPKAMIAVSEHSDFRADPWGRLHRTSHFLSMTTFGTIDDAERSIQTVRSIHSRVTGVAADGLPYRADDPHLLMWVHVAEVDSFLASHQTFGQLPLTPAQADEYVRQTGMAAAKLGVVDPPQTTAELARCLAGYRSELTLSPPAREAADLLLQDPPLTGSALVGYRVLANGAISILPAWARAELRLPAPPVSRRLTARPLAGSALSVLRWALAHNRHGDHTALQSVE